jgi:hypothetical protein
MKAIVQKGPLADTSTSMTHDESEITKVRKFRKIVKRSRFPRTKLTACSCLDRVGWKWRLKASGALRRED